MYGVQASPERKCSVIVAKGGAYLLIVGNAGCLVRSVHGFLANSFSGITQFCYSLVRKADEALIPNQRSNQAIAVPTTSNNNKLVYLRLASKSPKGHSTTTSCCSFFQSFSTSDAASTIQSITSPWRFASSAAPSLFCASGLAFAQL